MVESHADLDEETLVLSGFTAGAFFGERYRLEQLLGAGAMGKVFRATDTLSDRPVALKVLHLDKARKPQILARFRREAEILRALGHPGIVSVYASGQSREGIDYIAMELLEGRTLKQKTRDEGPADPVRLLPILVGLCDALGAAHEQGVVHRDLKPENIIMVETCVPETVKIVDFGLSRLATNERLTKTGTMMGTPRYMAPEQIRSAKDADSRTDIYACGVIVHETLTGASPFPAGDPGQLLGCVMEGRVLRLEDERGGLPPGLGDVVRKAMARDPRDRYATVGAFAEAYAATLGTSTGRSQLVTGGLDLLFAEAESTDRHRAPLSLSGERVAPALPSRFTLPPPAPAKRARAAGDRAHRAAPGPAATDGASRRSVLGVALFLLALLAVTCLSASFAMAVRVYLRAADGGNAPFFSAMDPAHHERADAERRDRAEHRPPGLDDSVSSTG